MARQTRSRNYTERIRDLVEFRGGSRCTYTKQIGYRLDGYYSGRRKWVVAVVDFSEQYARSLTNWDHYELVSRDVIRWHVRIGYAEVSASADEAVDIVLINGHVTGYTNARDLFSEFPANKYEVPEAGNG